MRSPSRLLAIVALSRASVSFQHKLRGRIVPRPFVFIGIILASAAIAHGQATQRDIPYGAANEEKLDLSTPAANGFATVIFVHGGSLTSGDKTDSDYGKVCEPFVKAGIGCANMNYRLAPGSRWPAQPEDVAMAIAWVKAHIGQRGGDPRKLFLLGHSSGAMLVAVIGSDERFLAKYQMKPGDLRGVMPMGSIMWDMDLDEEQQQYGHERLAQAFAHQSTSQTYSSLDEYRDSWPIHHVKAGMPPFLFLIAETEQEHPPVLETNSKFVDEARKLGDDASYRILTDRNHYSAIRKLSDPGDPVFEIVRSFAERWSK